MLGCNESIWLVVKSSVTFKPLGQCGKDRGGGPSKPPRTLVLGPISVYILLLHFLQQACNVSRTLEHFFFFIAILTLFFYNKLRFWSDVKPIKKLTPTVKRKKKSTCLKCKRNICGMGKEFFSKLCNLYSCIQQVSMFLLLFPGARSLPRKAPNIATTSHAPAHSYQATKDLALQMF